MRLGFVTLLFGVGLLSRVVHSDAQPDAAEEPPLENTASEQPPAVDVDPSCPSWAANGECQVNRAYMLKNCPVSCRRTAEAEAAKEAAEATEAAAAAEPSVCSAAALADGTCTPPAVASEPPAEPPAEPVAEPPAEPVAATATAEAAEEASPEAADEAAREAPPNPEDAQAAEEDQHLAATVSATTTQAPPSEEHPPVLQDPAVVPPPAMEAGPGDAVEPPATQEAHPAAPEVAAEALPRVTPPVAPPVTPPVTQPVTPPVMQQVTPLAAPQQQPPPPPPISSPNSIPGDERDWKGAVIAIHSVVKTLAQWTSTMFADAGEVATKLLYADPPLNIIVIIFTMFMSVLVFFRTLPTGSGPVQAVQLPSPSRPAPSPQPQPASAETAGALAALQKQVEDLQRTQQQSMAEMQRSVAEALQGVARLSTQVHAFQGDRSAVDDELLLASKEILEWIGGTGASASAGPQPAAALRPEANAVANPSVPPPALGAVADAPPAMPAQAQPQEPTPPFSRPQAFPVQPPQPGGAQWPVQGGQPVRPPAARGPGGPPLQPFGRPDL